MKIDPSKTPLVSTSAIQAGQASEQKEMSPQSFRHFLLTEIRRNNIALALELISNATQAQKRAFDTDIFFGAVQRNSIDLI